MFSQDHRRLINVFFIVIAILFSTSCKTEDECSTHSDCGDGQYCTDGGSCSDIPDDAYTVSFPGYEAENQITAEEDVDDSDDIVQVNIPVKLEASAGMPSDGLEVFLTVTAGELKDVYEGSIVDDTVWFRNVPLSSDAQNTVVATLKKDENVSSEMTITVLPVSIGLYYYKNADAGSAALLSGASVTDADDSDTTKSGLQISIEARTEGISQGETVSLYIDSVNTDPVADGSVTADGTVLFSSVDIPAQSSVTMRVVSQYTAGGETQTYEDTVTFSVDTSQICMFSVNIPENAVYSASDDENTDTDTTLDYTLEVTDIQGCAADSKVRVYVNGTPGVDTPSYTFTASGGSASQSIAVPESASVDDTASVAVQVVDDVNDLTGTVTRQGILVDLHAPVATVAYPASGQTLTMDDDIDSSTDGLQFNFTGTVSDAIDSGVDVTVNIADSTVAELNDQGGSYEVPYEFTQSIESVSAELVFTDTAGNENTVTVPFSVELESYIWFETICSKLGDDIVNNMWLNAAQDTDSNTSGVQCDIVVGVKDGINATKVSLKTGLDPAVEKDIGSGGETTFPVTLSNTSQGIDILAQTAGTGSDTGRSVTLTLRVDAEIPRVTINNNLGITDGDTTTSADVTFTLTEEDLTVCDFKYRRDSEAYTSYADVSNVPYASLSDADHVLYVTARDAAGNESVETTFSWTIDTTAPETTITTDDLPEKTNSDSILFSFEADEAGATFECKLLKDGANYNPADDSWSECNMGSKEYSELVDGDYTFNVRASDAGGNVDATPAEHSWQVGTTAPETTIDTQTPADNPTNFGTMTIDFSSVTGTTFECRLDKNSNPFFAWEDCSSGSKTYNGLDDAQYVFKVRAADDFGNTDASPATYGWRVDSLAPKVKFTAKPSKTSPYTDGSFSFQCVGESSSCTFSCDLDGVETSCTSPKTYTGLSDDSHTFSVTATDDAGNESVVVTSDSDPYQNSYTWTVDQTVLGVEITSGPDNPATTTDAAFEFSSNMPAATFECRLDGGAWSVCSSPQNYSGLSEQEHTFEVKASEGGDEATADFTWTIDMSDPVITLSGPVSPTAETDATFVFSANESVIGFECKLDSDAEWSSCVSPVSYPADTFGTEGSVTDHTFNVRASDAAGNSGTVAHTWTVDREVPTIAYVSPEANGDGDIIVGKSDDIYLSDENLYAINVQVTVAGAQVGDTISVTGAHSPPGYDPVEITTENSKTYTLEIGLQKGLYTYNPLTFSVSDAAGNAAVLSRTIIVNTEEMTITWNSPADETAFLSGGSTPEFKFNLWNAPAGTTVELVDDSDDSIVATVDAEGAIGAWEVVTVSPTLEDSCTPYSLYARVYDEVEGTYHYVDSTNEKESRSVRSFTVDKTAPVVTAFVHLSDANGDDVLYSEEDESSKTDGLQAGFELSVTGADDETLEITSSNTVSFEDGTTPVAGTVSSGSIVFDGVDNQFLTLAEGTHTLTAVVTDCSGNESDPVDVGPFSVDTEGPEILVNSIEPSADVLNTSSGTVISDELTGIIMTVPFGEDLTGQNLGITHEIYNYSDDLQSSELLSAQTVSGTEVSFTLPNMGYNKHKFIFNIKDANGNPAETQSKTYEVDPVAPEVTITFPQHDPASYDDQDAGTGGFQSYLTTDLSSVSPESSVKVEAVPVDAVGGSETGDPADVLCARDVTTAGLFRCPAGTDYFTLGKGFWRFVVTVTDDHDNTVTSASPNDVEVVTDAPANNLYKYYGDTRGDKISSDSWFSSDEGSFSGGYFRTDIEVDTTDISSDTAPDGTLVDLIVNEGTADEWSQTDVAVSDGSAVFNDVDLLTSGAVNTIKSIVHGTEDSEVVLNNVRADETDPVVTLVNPSADSDPVLYTGGGIQEVGYGYEDDANHSTPDTFDFPAGNCLRLEITSGATAGTVTAASTETVGGTATEDIDLQKAITLSGVTGTFERSEIVTGGTSGATGIVDCTKNGLHLAEVTGTFQASETVTGGTSGAEATADSIADEYIVMFEQLTLEDTNTDGQTDHVMTFTVEEQGSENTATLDLTAHVDLKRPASPTLDITYTPKRGKVVVEWGTVSGNDSNPQTVGAVYDYQIRYQEYNTSCSIDDTTFGNMTEPLVAIAEEMPDPEASGDMTYTFYVNRLGICDEGYCSDEQYTSESTCESNGETWTWYSSKTTCENNSGTWTEADIHKNGDKYCFGIRAVDGVYADDGTLLAENNGVVEAGSVSDQGANTYQINTILPEDADSVSFPITIKDVGDMNGDAVRDYAFGATGRKPNGSFGYVSVHSGVDDSVLESFTESMQGIGISDESDFNGDGIADFAFYDYFGVIHIFHGKTVDGSDPVRYELDTVSEITLDVKNAPLGPDSEAGDGPGTNAFGSGFATADHNGDGYTDIIVGFSDWTHKGNSDAGAVFIYYGNESKSYSVDSPDLSLYGTATAQQLGRTIRKAGKLKGGAHDAVIVEKMDNNTVYLFYGSETPDWSEKVEITNAGTAPVKRMTYGDCNNDGVDDLIVSNRSQIRFYYGDAAGIGSDTNYIKIELGEIAERWFELGSNFAVFLPTKVLNVFNTDAADVVSVGDDGFLVYSGELLQSSYVAGPVDADYEEPVVSYKKTYSSSNITALHMSYGLIYCNSEAGKNSCYIYK